MAYPWVLDRSTHGSPSSPPKHHNTSRHHTSHRRPKKLPPPAFLNTRWGRDEDARLHRYEYNGNLQMNRCRLQDFPVYPDNLFEFAGAAPGAAPEAKDAVPSSEFDAPATATFSSPEDEDWSPGEKSAWSPDSTPDLSPSGSPRQSASPEPSSPTLPSSPMLPSSPVALPDSSDDAPDLSTLNIADTDHALTKPTSPNEDNPKIPSPRPSANYSLFPLDSTHTKSSHHPRHPGRRPPSPTLNPVYSFPTPPTTRSSSMSRSRRVPVPPALGGEMKIPAPTEEQVRRYVEKPLPLKPGVNDGIVVKDDGSLMGVSIVIDPCKNAESMRWNKKGLRREKRCVSDASCRGESMLSFVAEGGRGTVCSWALRCYS